MEKANASHLNPNDTSVWSHGLEESKRTQIQVHDSELDQSRLKKPHT